MNEEYKKKYLKYKIKYLELIGGSTDFQGRAQKETEITIYSIFDILKEKSEDQIKEELKEEKYNKIYINDNLVDKIAFAIDESFLSNYTEEIDNIKTYIGDKHIDGLFRNELYKLFIFIVVEFGKLLNCENTKQVQNMIKILNSSSD